MTETDTKLKHLCKCLPVEYSIYIAIDILYVPSSPWTIRSCDQKSLLFFCCLLLFFLSLAIYLQVKAFLKGVAEGGLLLNEPRVRRKLPTPGTLPR